MPVGAPNFRNAWQQELDNLGFPSANNIRKVAVTNGSVNGTLQGTACQPVLEMDANLSLKTFLFRTKGIRVAKAQVWFTGSYGSYCPVFDGWAKIWFNTNGRSAAAPTSSKSYDIVPGGYFGTQQEIADIGSGFSPLFKGGSIGPYATFNVMNPNHAFIPTMSALAMDVVNKDLSQDLSNRNLVCTGEIPFDAYYGESANSDHITFTSGNVAWIKNQINNQPSSSPYPIQLVSGNEPLCTNSTTYQVAGLPANSTVRWEVTPGNIISITPATGSQTTATRISNGSATLTATITLCTGEVYIATRSVTAGGPDNTKLLVINQTPCSGYPVGFGARYETISGYCSLLNAGITDVDWDIYTLSLSDCKYLQHFRMR